MAPAPPRRQFRRRRDGQRYVPVDPYSCGESEPRRSEGHIRLVQPERRDSALVHAGRRRSPRQNRHRPGSDAGRDRRTDPADKTTRDAARYMPSSYRTALTADGLKGARIGVLRALFGRAAEDEEVAGTSIGHQVSDRRNRSHAVKRAGTRQSLTSALACRTWSAATIAHRSSRLALSVPSDGDDETPPLLLTGGLLVRIQPEEPFP